MNQPSTSVLICATIVASIVMGGTFALLLVGRPIPEWLPVFDAGVLTAYFGAGPFSVAVGHIRGLAEQAGATNTALIDTVNHGIATLRDAVGALTKPSATPPTDGGGKEP